MKKYLQKIYQTLQSLIIPICCLIIVVFWIYLLLQSEVRSSLWLLISNIDLNTLVLSLIVIGFVFIPKKLKEFKQELFDKIEREHRSTISYLQSNLTAQINYSTKAILLQEKLRK